VKTLSVEEITAIAFASVLFGSSCWASLPKMFGALEPITLDDVLCSLRLLLASKFNDSLAQWFCVSWKYLEV
jgi:hypothetical protein